MLALNGLRNPQVGIEAVTHQMLRHPSSTYMHKRTCLPANERPTQIEPNVQIQQRSQIWTDSVGVARSHTWTYSGEPFLTRTVTGPDGGVTKHTPCDSNSLFSYSECTTTLPNGDTVSRTWQLQCLWSGYGNQQIEQEVRTINTSQANGGP